MATVFNGVLDVTYKSDVSLVPIKGQLQLKFNQIYTNSINEHIFNFINLQLPVQSLPITTDVMSSNAVHGEMYTVQHCVIKFVSYLRQIGVSFQVLRLVSDSASVLDDWVSAANEVSPVAR
jgi:hypothetical protein